mmetsp:Transcript_953/g.2552  ORF Transcript_953/g.2552 Transcript_953/m.2552 type:complete len:203 (+) Transcript_953:4791-5399(+)
MRRALEQRLPAGLVGGCVRRAAEQPVVLGAGFELQPRGDDTREAGEGPDLRLRSVREAHDQITRRCQQQLGGDQHQRVIYSHARLELPAHDPHARGHLRAAPLAQGLLVRREERRVHAAHLLPERALALIALGPAHAHPHGVVVAQRIVLRRLELDERVQAPKPVFVQHEGAALVLAVLASEQPQLLAGGLGVQLGDLLAVQ